MARSALALLGRDSDILLQVAGHYNVAFYLAEAGRYEEVAEQLEADRALYEQIREPWLQLRLSWLRGDIAAASGDLAQAEQSYLETRDGCIARESATTRR